MTSGPVVGGVIDPKQGVATVGGRTYTLHPRASFGARLVSFVARLLTLAIVGAVAFGSGYYLQEREGLQEQQQLRETIATLEKEVLEAQTALRVRDESSMTIELDLTQILGDLRAELAQAAERRLQDVSGQIQSALEDAAASADPPLIPPVDQPAPQTLPPTSIPPRTQPEDTDDAASTQLTPDHVNALLATGPHQAEPVLEQDAETGEDQLEIETDGRISQAVQSGVSNEPGRAEATVVLRPVPTISLR